MLTMGMAVTTAADKTASSQSLKLLTIAIMWDTQNKALPNSRNTPARNQYFLFLLSGYFISKSLSVEQGNMAPLIQGSS